MRKINVNFEIHNSILEIFEILDKIYAGNRWALSKAITLVESKLPKHREQAMTLFSTLETPVTISKRIAFSGSPGVGKSTFIERFGLMLVEKGYKIAVLAIDPSSQISGGSILGDKTRMEKLAANPNVFIRPTASSGYMGGVAATTFEVMSLCEAAGFDWILVETVGVGQSEMQAAHLTDVFVYLQNPTEGDELQGYKRGIMEMAHLIFVNRADLDEKKALLKKVELEQTIKFLPNEDKLPKKVLVGSAINLLGLSSIINQIEIFYSTKNLPILLEKREKQKAQRVYHYLQELILNHLDKNQLDDFIAQHPNKNPIEVAMAYYQKHIIFESN